MLRMPVGIRADSNGIRAASNVFPSCTNWYTIDRVHTFKEKEQNFLKKEC